VLSDALDQALRNAVAARVALSRHERDLVVRARSEGASWRELGESLGLSKHAVRKRHLAVDPRGPRNSERPPTIAEYHDEMMRALRSARRESAT
jgi:hypothetical protein